MNSVLRYFSAVLIILVASPSSAQQPFELFQQNDRYCLRIADSLLGRQMLVFSRIVEVRGNRSVDLSCNRGGKTVEEVYRFVQGQNGKIAFELMCYERHYTAHTPVSEARNNIGKIVTVTEFGILSYSKQTATYLLDVSSLINTDNNLIYITKGSRNCLGLNKVTNLSFSVASIQTNPGSIEIRTGRYADNTLLLDLNTSLLMLPKEPMRARYSDSRLNYFEQKKTAFQSSDSSGSTGQMINRWWLEPKTEDRARYEKGQLVEPAKPIVYYIDTATPEKWVEYFVLGVTDWQRAFEKAGFKNAIQARRVPKDSLFIINDSRYSILRYNSLKIPNAGYSLVVDPRSGEIIQSNILWSEGMVKEYEERYIVMVSPVDTRARNPELPDSTKGELIRYVIQHEVGHSLGFQHNMIASNSVPVNKLRDKKWVELNGISPSIMEYARFNYLAQPGDNITARKGLINDIGAYDEWAIKWGYSAFPASMSEKVKKNILEKWIMEKSSVKVYRDGGYADEDDPRTQAEDLGDDVVQAGTYGIKNLQFVISELSGWSNDSNYRKSRLIELYDQVIVEYNWYISHAMTNLTGAYISTYLPGKETTTPVPLDIQKAALKFIENQFFAMPEWLIDPTLLRNLGLNREDVLTRIQTGFLNKYLSPYRLSKIERREANQFSYTLSHYLRDISQSLFSDLSSRHSADKHRQTLQKNYIKNLTKLVSARVPGNSAFQSGPVEKIKAELLTLKNQIKEQTTRSTSGDHAYLEDLLELLSKS